MRLGDHPFIPSLAPDPTKGPGDVSLLTGIKHLVSFDSNPPNPEGTVTLSQLSKTRFDLVYDLTQEDSFGGSITSFDDFGTTPKETRDLSGLTLVVGVQDAGSPALLLQLEDASGAKDQVRLTGIDSTERFYAIPLSLFDEIDLTRITVIVFLLEEDRLPDPTSTLKVRLGDHPFIATIFPDPDLTSGDVTALPPTPLLDAFGEAALNQFSSSLFDILYDVTDTFSFGGASIHYDDFGTEAPEFKDFFGIESLVFGLKGPDGAVIKFEITDADGKTSFIFLKGIKSTDQFWRIPLNLFEINIRRVTGINFVFENARTPVKRGTVRVHTRGLAFVPFADPDPTKTVSDITHFSGIKSVATFDSGPPDPNGILARELLSPNRVNVGYDLTEEGSFGGLIYAFDDFGTPAIETGNLSSLTNIVLGLRDAGFGDVTLQLEDSVGNRSKVFLRKVDPLERFWTVPVSLFNGVDLTRIRAIVFVLEQKRLHRPLSTLEIRIGDHPFTPSLPFIFSQTFDETRITSLTHDPSVAITSGNTSGGAAGIGRLDPIDPDRFDFEFDTRPHRGSFVTASIQWGEFVNGSFHGTPGSLPTEWVLGLRGPAGARVRIEVVDTSRNRASVFALLTGGFQNYTVPLTGFHVPDDFAPNSIAQVNFKMDRRRLTNNATTGVIQVRTKGLDITPPPFPDFLLEFRDRLVNDTLSYFQVGVGVDPVNHFPYDSLNEEGVPVDADNVPKKLTQPTSIGFYLQILADQLNGAIPTSSDPNSLLTELQAVTDNLLTGQATVGWKGLLTFMTMDPLKRDSDILGFVDNVNLAQSTAAMIGALERANLTPPQREKADAIIDKAKTFLDQMKPGFLELADPIHGQFRAVVNMATGQFAGFIDRLATEFRSGILFLLLLYPELQTQMILSLPAVFRDYTAMDGSKITNLVSFHGSAFQIFWPILRGEERADFEFRQALHNYLVTALDNAAKIRLPGIPSASALPNNGYFGDIGIREAAETDGDILMDLGSTYALAAAYRIAPLEVLNWLYQIGTQLPALMGAHGFFDAARSPTEVAKRFFAIDVGSTLLGIQGGGPEDFEAYLRSRKLEASYHNLIDSYALGLTRTAVEIPDPPTFPDRTLASFSHLAGEGTIGDFPAHLTALTGARYEFGNLAGGFGGKFWNLDQVYDARANKLVLLLSVFDTPKQLKLEFKDAAGNLLLGMTVDIPASPEFQTHTLNLPNLATLENVARVLMVVDQNATGDTSADFHIHAIDFQHLPGTHHSSPPLDSLASLDPHFNPGAPDSRSTIHSADSDSPHFVPAEVPDLIRPTSVVTGSLSYSLPWSIERIASRLSAASKNASRRKRSSRQGHSRFRR